MKKTIFALAASSVFLMACNKHEQPSTPADAETSRQAAATMTSSNTASTPSNTNSGHSAEHMLDWEGEYEGVLPCADCEGIKTKLELHTDKTYELKEEYLGKGKDAEFKVKGLFHFDDANPALIVLDKAGDQRKFFVGENFVELRDSVTGEKASSKLNYTLAKKAD